jgi:hypothetical protein
MIKIIGIIIVTVAVLAGIASRFVFKKSDNIVEEIAEHIIKNKTGHDVDLSPDTPEKKEPDGKDKCNK